MYQKKNKKNKKKQKGNSKKIKRIDYKLKLKLFLSVNYV